MGLSGEGKAEREKEVRVGTGKEDNDFIVVSLIDWVEWSIILFYLIILLK